MAMNNQMSDWLALDGSDVNLKINLMTNHYAFARAMNALPLAQSEFELACKSYPIVFIAADNEGRTLQSVALMSFQAGQNVFVRADNTWEPLHYVPAFAKRHPFQLGVDQQQTKPLLFVEKNYPGLNQVDGIALYEGTEPSSYLEQMMHALRTLQIELEQTALWIKRLQEKNLLVERSVSISVNDKTEHIAGVWVVDTDKLSELSDEELAQMYHNGTLALIEQHRLSLGNLDQLAQRASI